MWLRTFCRKGAVRIVVALWALLLALPAAAAGGKTVLVMGDSLSAAYGLAAEQGWVALLAKKLESEGSPWRVVNASISGETTAGGASRIEAALETHAPSVVVIELGANDGLRGLDLGQATANLERMIVAAESAGAEVLLIGIRIPPNYGPDYSAAVDAMYVDLAKKHDTQLLPFLLEPIATDRDAFLPDNLHPTAASQPKLMEHVWTKLGAMLAE